MEHVPGSLEIRVNRDLPNTLEVPETFETTDDFQVEITNEGKPVHIHLNYEDDFANRMSLETGNHFIPRKGVFTLPVEIDKSQRPFHGKLRVSTGYGSTTKFVEVRVVKPSGAREVSIDEDLAKPPIRETRVSALERLVGEMGILILLGIALLALFLGAMIVATITTPLLGLVLVMIALLLATGAIIVLDED